METNRHLHIGAVCVIALGTIHTLATPVVFAGLRALPLDQFLALLCMFLMAGWAVLAIGVMQRFLLQRLNVHRDFGRLLKATILFMLLFGVVAVATMWDNPFAYLTLGVAGYEGWALRRLHKGTS